MWHPNADPLPMLRYVVCAIDATLWSGDVIMEAVKMLNTIVSMGSGNVGYIQLPISHSAVKLETIVNYTRKIEDPLLKAKLDFTTRLTLTYSRESVRAGSDKRASTQPALMVVSDRATSKWLESDCGQSNVFGPLPVCPVSEMIGYDPENKPSPGQRAAQSLAV